jgi:hypothetical protein
LTARHWPLLLVAMMVTAFVPKSVTFALQKSYWSCQEKLDVWGNLLRHVEVLTPGKPLTQQPFPYASKLVQIMPTVLSSQSSSSYMVAVAAKALLVMARVNNMILYIASKGDA